MTEECGSHGLYAAGLHWVMRIQEGVTGWGEVGTGLRPTRKTLNNSHFAAVDAGRVDISL